MISLLVVVATSVLAMVLLFAGIGLLRGGGVEPVYRQHRVIDAYSQREIEREADRIVTASGDPAIMNNDQFIRWFDREFNQPENIWAKYDVPE